MATSWASSTGVRKSMLSNRRRDTGPELAIRRMLFARGLRYRVDWRPSKSSRSRADIAFTKARVLIFVDGCFWHGCPEHATYPRTNSEYWLPKLRRNKERDVETTMLLQKEDWSVLRFWEHEDPAEVVRAIVDSL